MYKGSIKNGWCTGYALSICGEEMYDNCPFGNGNGYGDGRCISIAQLEVDKTVFEVQLKGGGGTAFRREGDGRSSLRSSVREFLASVLMFALGVETCESLSLIVSQEDKVQRAWYQSAESQRPDVVIHEKVAICSRVSHSFIRVGSLELHARRYRRNQTVQNRHVLVRMLDFLISQTYPQIDPQIQPHI